MFTITNKQLLVKGVPVATIKNDQARDVLLRALMATLSNRDRAFLAVSFLGEARTADIARLIGMDRSNVSRVLDDLADEGVVEVVDECDNDGKAGRPSRVWALATA